MAQDITAEEAAIRRHMSSIYKSQENSPNGFDDWGMFTAHVVYTQRKEIERLRDILKEKNIDPGPWDDPFEF